MKVLYSKSVINMMYPSAEIKYEGRLDADFFTIKEVIEIKDKKVVVVVGKVQNGKGEYVSW
jgi:hypothetical protein